MSFVGLENILEQTMHLFVLDLWAVCVNSSDSSGRGASLADKATALEGSSSVKS